MADLVTEMHSPEDRKPKLKGPEKPKDEPSSPFCEINVEAGVEWAVWQQWRSGRWAVCGSRGLVMFLVFGVLEVLLAAKAHHFRNEHHNPSKVNLQRTHEQNPKDGKHSNPNSNSPTTKP